jgi:hypothetical protein
VPHRSRQLAAWCVSACAAASPATAQLRAERLFNASGAGVPIAVTAQAEASILLYDPAQDEPIAEASIRSGPGDLERLFPDLRSLAADGVIFAQLIAGGVPVGGPMVIEPLVPLRRAVDAWSARVVRALDANDRTTLDSLLRMPPRARESLRQTVEVIEADGAASPALRVYEERLVALSTEDGVITIALRPDASPHPPSA